MKTSKWKQNEKTFILLAVLVLLAVVVGFFKPDKFYTMANFQSMSRQLAEIGIYALATFVIVVSGFEKSIDDRQFGVVEQVEFYINNGMDKMEAIKVVAREREMKKNDVYAMYHQEARK